jgi:hypothetical protein
MGNHDRGLEDSNRFGTETLARWVCTRRLRLPFDIYGTLVNRLAMADHLNSLVGDVAGRFRGTVAYKAARIFVLAKPDASISAFFDLHLGSVVLYGESTRRGPCRRIARSSHAAIQAVAAFHTGSGVICRDVPEVGKGTGSIIDRENRA